MNKKPLKTLFSSMFHDKYKFIDFKSMRTENNIQRINFKKREVIAPSKTLKEYHGFLNLFIFKNFKINENVVFSYRKGVNVVDAVKKHSRGNYYYATDLRNFFPSISSGLVREVLADNICELPVADIEEYLDVIINLVTVDGRLPFGFSTSPVISNACLLKFDNDMELRAKELNAEYSRYSDDLIFSSNDKQSLIKIAQSVKESLANFYGGELTVNDSKSRFTHRGSKVKFLGAVILPDGTVTVDKKFKQQIEIWLHHYINDKEKLSDMFQGDLDKAIEQLSGSINYVKTVDPKYIEKLCGKYGSSVVDIFIHKSVKK